MSQAFVLGYDPGGNGAHGLAVVEVREGGARWRAESLRLKVAATLDEAVIWTLEACRGGRIMAVGIDTLTQWSSGPGGWRPADRWLQARYHDVAGSVISPNRLFGAMLINGASFVVLQRNRFEADGTQITEAHPKVCYYALTNSRHRWSPDRDSMVAFLEGQLGSELPDECRGPSDHCFDAGMSALAALRGVNGEWSLDLLSLPTHEGCSMVRPLGPTHYWWPTPDGGHQT